MATRSDDPQTTKLKRANRELKLALQECRESLKRCEMMIRRARQDNDRQLSD
jgi:hypothetical protein